MQLRPLFEDEHKAKSAYGLADSSQKGFLDAALESALETKELRL